MSPKSTTFSASSRFGKTRIPAHSGPLNSVAAEGPDRQISGQPYPRAKPRKFIMFRQLSNSEHSVDGIKDDIDATHYPKPKSRLKIAWSNENRTMNRAKPRKAAQNSSESAFVCQNDSEKDSLLPSTSIVNTPPITAVTRAVMPASLHTNPSVPQSQNIELQIRHETLNTSSSQMSSASTPLLTPVHLSETPTVRQFPNAAFLSHQQTSSPQTTFDNDNQRNVESDIDDYMHSSSSGSLYDSSPARYSSTVTTPNTSPSPMASTATKLETVTNILSKKDSHFDTQLSPLNVLSPPENALSTPAPARSIGVIDDTILIALTEPFLMAWCEDITRESLALHTQDYWMDGNSVDNLWCLDSGMTR